MGFSEHRDRTGAEGWEATWYVLTSDPFHERPGTDRCLARFELELEDDGEERTYRLENVAPALEAEHRDRVYRLEKEVDRRVKTLDLGGVYDEPGWWSDDPRMETLRYDERGNAERVLFCEERRLGEDIYRSSDMIAERSTLSHWDADGAWHVEGTMQRIVASPTEAFRVIEDETGVDAAGYVDDVVDGRLNW